MVFKGLRERLAKARAEKKVRKAQERAAGRIAIDKERAALLKARTIEAERIGRERAKIEAEERIKRIRAGAKQPSGFQRFIGQFQKPKPTPTPVRASPRKIDESALKGLSKKQRKKVLRALRKTSRPAPAMRQPVQQPTQPRPAPITGSQFARMRLPDRL